MSASCVPCNASTVASGRRFLSAYRFSYWLKAGDWRTFDVVGFTFAEACVSACAISDNNDTLRPENVERELIGNAGRSLRGYAPALGYDFHGERYLLAIHPIDPRD